MKTFFILEIDLFCAIFRKIAWSVGNCNAISENTVAGEFHFQLW